MTNTIKLYYDDAYIKSFSAMVISSCPAEDGMYEIVLDKTAFFPEGGGQGSDRGTIAGAEVLDVQIRDDVIFHKVSFSSDPSSLIGSKVPCHLDFDRRFSNMQQHSGEHIFSGLVKKLFCYENVGFHLSDNIVTMDYDGKLSSEDITHLEKLSNEAIFRNLPVVCRFPDNEELETLDYRSKLDASQMSSIRIVSIQDIDICACCAPHVRSTGEVGILKVVDYFPHRSGTRLSILCGMRALLDYSHKHDQLLQVSRHLSVPAAEVFQGVKKITNDLSGRELYIRQLEEQLLEAAISNCDPEMPVLFCNISDSILLRNTVNRLQESSTASTLAFNGTDEGGYSFIIASKKDDAQNIMHRLSESIEIKGGGKPVMVQGHTPATKSAILEAIRQLP